MHAIIENNQAHIADLCRMFSVRRLDLFGSAASDGPFDETTSDFDFLVEFDLSTELRPADQYFGLLQALGDLLGRKVDLMTARSMKNPYFIKSVNQTRQTLYASQVSKAS